MQLHYETINLLQQIDELSAGCDPDFDAGLDELDREFASLRPTLDHL
jgi:hypothetical protein